MESDKHADLLLAQQAQAGDTKARLRVNAIANPIIQYQNSRFCKRFCREHQYQYRCTLEKPVGNPSADAPLCEWGNAGYAWMLDELTRPERLKRYAAKNDASLKSYFFYIANSLAFYERWKDWRFGRRVYVPEYIRDISPHAAKVFFMLRTSESLEAIAQAITQDKGATEKLVSQIVTELVKRKRLYLLNAPENVSLTHAEDATDIELPVSGFDVEQDEQRELFVQAWEQLTEIEQFVLEAMLLEKKSADAVLHALNEMGVTLSQAEPASPNNRQQLYYFRRKALDRLSTIIKSNMG